MADSHARRPSVVLGGVLVLIGAILLVGQVVRIDVEHYGWPFFVIAPGVAILFLGLMARGVFGEGVAILGSMITVTGLILLYQNATGHFETWAYGWALIPASIGAGMQLYGWLAHRPRNVEIGTRILGAGLVVFFLGALFFEGVIGIGGHQFGRSTGVAVGAVIIAMGALLLILNLTSGRRQSR
jgi:nitrate reductase gamma subunit